MMILDRALIERILDLKNNLSSIMQAIADELIHFSNGCSINASPIHLDFTDRKGECHIKAGYNKTDDLFVIKVATGFYNNSEIDLPSSNGVMMVFCKNTGAIKAILCDGGYLTTVRTAITGCLAAALTPWSINRICIVGTGELAQLIIQLMHQSYPTVPILLWGRNEAKVKKIQDDYPYVIYENSLSNLVQKGGIVFTTTASQTPLIFTDHIYNKTHLIALGADQPNKQEIDCEVFSMADKCIVDSKEQAIKCGNSAIALHNGNISSTDLVELGTVLQSGVKNNLKMLITDLTGIAPQDIGIAKFVTAHIVST